MTATRVLLLGIDAASPALLERWAGDGTMPALGALMRRGITGASRSVDGFFIGSTWPSFYTGTTPARHGLHYLVQLEPGTYDYARRADGEFVHGTPFWRTLSDAGRRVAIFDIPLSRLDGAVNGIHVVEWGGHDAVFGFGALPHAVEAEIRTRFGAHAAAGACDAGRRSPEEYAAFADTLVRGVRAKAELTLHYLRQGGWDLFAQVFTEAHCAGHQCWHLHDAGHPAYDATAAARAGHPLRRVYAAIDAAIGAIVAGAGDATVLVVVPHGMAHWYGAQFLLREILVRLGAAQPAAAGRARSPTFARRLWRAAPAGIRDRLRPVRDRIAVRSTASPTLGVDTARSLCFAVHNGLAVGGIRLNLAGREPTGTLRPEDAAGFCDDLAAALLAIMDDRTGRPLVRRVLRTDRLYDGDRLHLLPDLLVEWSDDVATGSTTVGDGRGATVRAHSDRTGPIEGTNHYGRTGEHRPDGMFVAAGPGLRPGRLDRTVGVMDFAPTVTAMLGVTMPGTDGTVIGELIERTGQGQGHV